MGNEGASPIKAEPDLSGRVLGGRYVLDRVLERRPLVVAYRAYDTKSACPVVVETLDDGIVHDPQLMPRVRQEAARAGALNHPNILAFYGLQQEKNITYTVREYVDGVRLSEYLARQDGKPRLYEILQVLQAIAAALDAAHGAGFIHWSLNPSNIWLHCDGRVALSGFGLPSLAGVSSETDVDAHFLAPELCTQGAPVDARADQYALAVLAYLGCTGRLPFIGEDKVPGDTEWDRLSWQHVNESPAFAGTLNRDLPQALAWVLAKALAKAPAARFRTAGEFIESAKRAMREGGLDPDAMLSEPPAWIRAPEPFRPPTPTKAPPNKAAPAGKLKPREPLVWIVGFMLIAAAVWGTLISLILARRDLPAAALTTAEPPGQVETWIDGGMIVPTWTPPVVVRTAPPRPVAAVPLSFPVPTIAPDRLPFNGLHPLSPEFDWKGYVDKVSWRAYTDPHFGYALVHPDGWQVVQGDNVLRLYMPERDAGVIVCSCGTRVADSAQWASRFLDLVRRDYPDVKAIDQRPWSGRWLSTLAHVPLGGDDLQIALLSFGQDGRGYGVAFIAWGTDWQGVRPIFDRMARELRFP